MTSDKMYRYKSIVIPYIKTKHNDKTYRSYVLVKDKTSKDLTFVVGGCKMREIPKKSVRDSTFYTDYDSYKTCALRELEQESRGVFGNVSKKALKQGFKFSSNERFNDEKNKDAEEGTVVTMRYTVYYLPLDLPKEAFKKENGKNGYIVKQFKNTKPKKNDPEYNETSGIILKTKSELNESKKLWRFMKERVLPKLTD